MQNSITNTRYEIIVEIVESYGTYSVGTEIISYPLTFKKYYVDTYDSEPITIDYQVSDVRDISTKKGSRSYSITVPETSNNRFVFGNISDLSGNNFNANLATPVWILVDTNEVFRGTLQLTNVLVNQSTNETQYEIVVYDDNASFYDALGDGFLSDDDYSYLSHTYSAINITQSWDKNWQLGYYYPLIDYGRSWAIDTMDGETFSSTASLPGYEFGYVNVQDFYPAIYVKTVMNQLFVDTGYSYNSKFFNSNKFQNLIIPSSTDLLTDKAYMLERSFEANLSMTQSLDVSNITWTPLAFDNTSYPYYDPSGSWNTSTFEYTNNTSTTFIQAFGISLDFFVPFSYSGLGVIKLFRSRGFGSATDTASWISGQGTPISMYNNQSFFPLTNFGNTIDVVSGILTSTPGTYLGVTGSFGSLRLTTQYLDGKGTNFFTGIDQGPIQPGESIRISFQNSSGVFGDIIPVFTTSFFFNQVNPRVFPGEVLTMNSVIPKQLKKKEFFMEIVNMFNLIVEPDPLNPKTLVIEPYNDFFNGGVIDWTNKVDTLTEYDAQIIAETQNRTTFFSYKEDKDFYNQDYKSRSQEIYGQYKYIINNYFLSGEKKIELKFSSTPLVAIPRADGALSSLVTPVIVNNSNVVNNVTFPQMTYRILTRTPNENGLVDLQNISDSWTFLPNGFTGSGFGSVVYDSYPYAGHFDDPYTPSYSLNFGTVSGLYYNGTIDPSDNLYGSYWENMLTEYSDPDSRILTLDIVLNSYDINQFSFRNLIYLDIDQIRGYYKVNKINQYVAGIEQPISVELLKTKITQIPKTQQPQVPSSLGFTNTVTGIISTSTTNTITGPHGLSIGGNNLLLGHGKQVLGSNNVVSGINTGVLGNNNNVNSHKSMFIGDNNITITGTTVSNSSLNGLFSFGSNNTFGPSASNSYIFGSGTTVSTPNTFVFGPNITEIIFPSGATISGLTSSPVIGPPDTLAFYDDSGNIGGIFTVLGSPTFSLAEGDPASQAIGRWSHAEGLSTASGTYSHSEGESTQAFGEASHTEGISNISNGFASHTEGGNTEADGDYSHAEGRATISTGDNSHAEGLSSVSFGIASHAEGSTTLSVGLASHSGGVRSVSNNFAEWSRSSNNGGGGVNGEYQYGIFSYYAVGLSPAVITEIFTDATSLRYQFASALNVGGTYRCTLTANTFGVGALGGSAIFGPFVFLMDSSTLNQLFDNTLTVQTTITIAPTARNSTSFNPSIILSANAGALIVNFDNTLGVNNANVSVKIEYERVGQV